MMEEGIILVAGISGVGKTTFCQRLTEAAAGIHHFVASSFVDGQQAVDQLRLVARIREAARERGGTSLVDGHLIVGGKKVPLEAVAALAPKAIVLVTGHPRDVVARRASDNTKQRPPLHEDDIALDQDAELQWARELAQSIGIPFATVDGSNQQALSPEVLHLVGAC